MSATTSQTPPPRPASPLTVSLTTITPTIAVPKAAITITGSVRNAGSVPITSAVARALIGERPLTSREAVSDWATSTGEQLVAEVARTSLGRTLAPGDVTTFALTVPATAIRHRESFAVLPLRVDVVGTTPAATPELGDLHTFLPALSSMKAYEPLSIAWLVPLTLDPDPALHGMDSAARTAAWTKAIGPGSRLDRLIQGTREHECHLGDRSCDSGPAADAHCDGCLGGAEPDPERLERPCAGQRCDPGSGDRGDHRARRPAQGSRATPYPLVLAVCRSRPRRPAPPRLRQPHPGHPDHPHLHPGCRRRPGAHRHRVAGRGTLTTQREQQLKQAFSSPGLSAAVTSASTLTSRSGSTGDASRKSSDGLPLLAYDEALSRTFTQTSSTAAGAITIQRFLADTMALLGERPGTPNRSVLVAAPRTFAGDPTVLRSFFAAIAKAPWLIPTTTDQLLAASKEATPEVPGVGTIVRPTSPARTAPDPLSPGTSPLTSARLGDHPGHDVRHHRHRQHP